MTKTLIMLYLATLLITLFLTPILVNAKTLVVHSSNRAGEIEPCGCQVHQTGGINRMAAWVEDAKKNAGIILLDSGDTFFSSQAPSPFRIEKERRRAKVIAESYKEMGLVALSPGERDFALGLNYLRELEKASGATFLSANLIDKSGKTIFPGRITIENRGSKIAILGVSGEDAFSTLDEFKVTSALVAVTNALEELKKENVTAVVVLSHAGLVQDRELRKLAPNLLVLGAHSLDSVAEKEADPNTNSVILQEQHEGQQIGVAELEGGHWANPVLVDLTTDWDKNNGIRKKMELFKKESEKLDGTKIEIRKNKDKPYVAHPQVCKSCHEEQYAFWENTKHSTSILVLYAKKQHKDPECVGCHSLGFRESNGFSRFADSIKTTGKSKDGFAENLLKEVFAGDAGGALDSRVDPKRHHVLHEKYLEKVHFYENQNKITKNYLGTQCEHCHGNRNGHPANLGKERNHVSEESCRKCHRPPNAPNFNADMIKLVACPLLKKSNEGTK